MATATADRLEDAARDEHGQALAEGEITRLLKTVQAAQFKKSDTLAAADNTEFKPRSLVEIAFAAEQKRQQAEQAAQAAQAAEQAAQAAERAAAEQAEQAGDDANAGTGDAAVLGTDAPDAVHAAQAAAQQVQNEAEAEARQKEAAARLQREQDDEALRLAAEEKGYKRGFEAGLDAARTAEPTAEELALQAEKEQEKQAIIAQFYDAIAALASPQALDSTALMQAIDEAVRHLAAERAGQVIAENPEGFMARIKQLVDRVKSASQQVDVFVNAADLAALNSWMQDHTAPSGWQFVADAQLGHGDIRLLLGGIEITDILKPVSAAPEQAVPEIIATEDAGPEITATEDALAAPEQVAPEQVDPEQVDPEQMASEQEAPEAAPAAETAADEAPEITPESTPEELSEDASETAAEGDSE